SNFAVTSDCRRAKGVRPSTARPVRARHQALGFAGGAVLLLLCGFIPPDRAIEHRQIFLRARIEGVINPIEARYVRRVLARAREQKAVNDMVSLARSLAKRRGRAEDVAEAMVRESKSYTADDALAAHVVELIAPSLQDLLHQLDGRQLDFPQRRLTLHTSGLA